jgi:hypothetical protein
MANAMSQIPESVAAASVLLTVYYLGRRGHGRSRFESWSGGRHAHGAGAKRK